MAIVPITSLLTGSSSPLLATGDIVPFVDVSDLTQSVNGSTVKATVAQFFAAIPVPIIVTSASANALAVGLAGSTNPALLVDASTALQAAGLKVVGAVAAGTVAVAVVSSGSNASLSVNAKGSGTIAIGNVSTGAVTITPATAITGTLSQQTANMTSAVKIGEVSDSTTFGTVSLNGTMTAAGLLGLQGKSGNDNLFYNTPTSGSTLHKFGVAGTIYVTIGQVSDSATYGIVSLNGVVTSTGFLGVQGKTGDATLYINAPTSGAVKLLVNGVTQLTVGSSTLGFFGATAAAKQTGVAVSAAAIHAALVTYGLISA